MNLNLLPFMAYCFSINETIYKDIDDLYSKNESRFYKSARENPEYATNIIVQGSIQQEEYYKKSLGILENSRDYSFEVNSLISKGWAFTYKYCQNNIDLDSILFLSEFGNYIPPDQNEELYNSNFIVFLYLGKSRILNREVIEEMIIDKFGLKNNNENNLDMYKKQLSNLIYEMVKRRYGDLQNFKDECYNKLRFTDDIKNTQFFIDLIFDTEKLSFGQIWNLYPLTDYEIENIFYNYVLSNPYMDEDNIKIDEIASNCLYSIYICKFIKAYKEIKKYYFTKIDALKDQVANSKIVIPEYKTDMEITLTRLQDRGTKELLDKIYKLEQENERLRNILELIKLNNQ